MTNQITKPDQKTKIKQYLLPEQLSSLFPTDVTN